MLAEEEKAENIKDLDELKKPFLIVRGSELHSRSLLQGGRSYKSFRRTDTSGRPIKNGGDHHIEFNEDVQVNMIENWKHHNVIPTDWNQE